ncbi:hypothetical protein [Streptomyces sp. MNP-20]|uniref:hypothetical protein n=1 Tax=Streptomyces sp. MNP-20 TaxID=2721165 RepID=UPI00155192B8|nr:hypothetical protein [Streptomyces sp. MNP-20]
MTVIAHPREAFPLAAGDSPAPFSSAHASTPDTRPWILRYARTPDATQAIVKPPAVYDEEAQLSVSLYDGPLPYMATHKPTVPDGNIKNPPPIDEGPKD